MAAEETEFLMQEGLLYPQPKYGNMYMLKVTTETTDKSVACLALKALIRNTWKQFNVRQFNVVVGFDPQVWEDVHKRISGWTEKAGKLEQRDEGMYIVPHSKKFVNTAGFCIIAVRTNQAGDALFIKRVNEFEAEVDKIVSQFKLKKEEQKCDAKDVISGLFVDGLANKTDPMIIQESTGCVGGVNGCPGGSYMLHQRFLFTWDILGQKNSSDISRMLGRHQDSTIVMAKSERAHIKCAHVTEPSLNARSNFKIHRLSMTFAVEDDDEHKGGFGGANKEDGIFYMSVAKSTTYIKKLLENMVGTQESVTNDLLISTVTTTDGAFYYVPAMKEFDETITIGDNPHHDLLLDHWNVKPSANDYLFYNHKEYLYRMGDSKNRKIGYKPYPDPPSGRVLSLLVAMFEQWDHTWFQEKTCHPIPHLEDVVPKTTLPNIMSLPLVVRKAWTIRLSLECIFTTNQFTDIENHYGRINDLFQIDPKDLLAGKMPIFGLGVGQIAMPYYVKDTETELSAENIMAYSAKLSETSGFGHVVPNYKKIIQKGIPAFLKELDAMISSFDPTTQGEKREYMESCKIAFVGIQKYMENYGLLAGLLASKGQSVEDIRFTLPKSERDNLTAMEARLKWLANGDSGDGKTDGTGKPRDLQEALQLLLVLHISLHLCCEPVSIGRLDVILEEFFDSTNPNNQDLVDCFWIKLGERAQINRQTRRDLYAVGCIAVPYRSDGKFGRGDGNNQWVQQATIGGYSVDENGVKQPPSASRIAIAKLCLNAARRLPLNAPCLSLRLHSDMDVDLIKEASKTILSGGAHPVLLRDECLIPALVSTNISENDATDYSSDGCYEPIVPGKTEFSFCYVPLLQVLEMTINRGATISEAGPSGMRGFAVSRELRPGSGDIRNMEDLKKQFGKHLRLQIHDAIFGLLSNYGNMYKAYASQLLSCMIDGCLETGRDIYNGGAAIKIIGCMLISFANTVDSLYGIQELCFGEKSMFSFEQMVKTLHADWGFSLQEPHHDPADGQLSCSISSENMKLAREFVLNLPKLGQRTKEKYSLKSFHSSYRPQTIKGIAEWLSNECVAAFKEVTTSDKYPLKDMLKNLNDRYGTTSDPSKFINFMLGSGSFEGYVGWGLGIGASADGRRRGQPIASDMSPGPIPQDLPELPRREENIYKLLKYWDIDAIKTGFPNGSEIDLTIDENTNEDSLSDFIKHYAKGQRRLGGNILTITCANHSSYNAALKNPEKYDLLRVRTGGWSEFYVSFYSAHQHQHLRRPYAVVVDHKMHKNK